MLVRRLLQPLRTMTAIAEACSDGERPLKRVKLSTNAADALPLPVPTPVPPEIATVPIIRKSYRYVPDYGSGLHLAPMVRCGTLPTRLLSLEYGANLVWGPETVDRAMIGCTREVDHVTGVVRFMKAGKSIWDTHPIEKDRLIYQIGSATPELAVQAAKLIEQDVAGVDLNCGCPKPFSTTGSMGAALLSEPDTLCAILRALIESLSVPVSCKIRLLPTQDATIDLVKRIVGTGISSLTVHCRTKDMRPREPALLDRLRDIVDAVAPFGIPVVANGDCLGFDDMQRIKDLTGVSSIMIARAAEANMSAFRKEGILDYRQVVQLYIRVAHALGNQFGNSKYCLNAMDFKSTRKEVGAAQQRKELKQALGQAKDYAQLARAFEAELCADPRSWQDLLSKPWLQS